MKPLSYEECRLKIAELNIYQGEIKRRLDEKQYNKELKAKINLEILGLANAMQRETRRIQLANLKLEVYEDNKNNFKSEIDIWLDEMQNKISNQLGKVRWDSNKEDV